MTLAGSELLCRADRPRADLQGKRRLTVTAFRHGRRRWRAARPSRPRGVGDIQQGRQLALDVCASCHAVRAGQTPSSVVAAPSFEVVANTPGMTATALAFWLTAHSHPTMPMIRLSQQEVDDVSAYILSLRD